ncbi:MULTISPECIES: outer membrane protein [unclassified Bradyrhizobium]|uniref:outer membrane protein n=1 Tax=unclassified Bradyrhizobium TaxID=2631580 RepID=UPI002FF1BB3E
MKKVLLVTASLIALGAAAPAVAADLAARPYTKAPPMVAAVYDWTGFYIGANGGYGTSRNSWNLLPGVGTFGEGSHDADGGTIGGQIGYRWQAGTWVFGVEAQGNWADFQGSNLSLLDPTVRNESRVNAFGLFTGQVGYAVNNVLLYVKGGAAVTSNEYRRFDVPTGALLATTNDDTRWGGVVGAGLEYGFAPNWSVGVEYNHLFMQDRTYAFTTPGGAFAGNVRIDQDVDLVTARINYRFGGPAVTRY